MGTRSFAQVAPTPATIALNAYIYGYGGHSLVTPHAALKQLWWTDQRIEAKVTRGFVVSKLRGEEREFLDKPLAFGEGLTDDTYMEWILERAKRLFLILAEVGVPDQIFGCIDDSWDDYDLPIPLEDVPNLELAYEDDQKLNKKFYDTQFIYLLRELTRGGHIDYGPREHIPMEFVNTVPPAVSLQIWDRVHFPGRPDDIYMRRKYSLSDKDGARDHNSSFMRDVRKAHLYAHEHVASMWASYTAEGHGYVLSDFVAEHTLGTFIDHRMPAQYQRVPPLERPVLLCEWMHCLSDALACLHHRGTAHTAIRPSNIVVSHSNRIAFADIGSLRTFQRGKKVNKIEVYDYAAPESQLSKPPLASSPPVSSRGAFNKLRKMSSGTDSSSGGSSAGGSTRSNSVCTYTSPTTPPPTGRSNSMTTITTTISPLPKSSGSFRNFSRHLIHHTSTNNSSTPTSPTSTTRVLPRPSILDPDTLCDLPAFSPEMSDIYSLGCIFLDIITFMVKGKTNEFVKFRTTKMSSPMSNSKRTCNDTSFHSDPDKIDTWMSILESDSERRNEKIFRGIPDLLRLIRVMMSQNATLRPSAREVRDHIHDILTGECGVDKLCCTDREWTVPSNPEAHSASTTTYLRDSIGGASEIMSTPSRTGSDCPRSGTQSDNQMSPLSPTESAAAAIHSRKRSSASVGTIKLNTWRRALSRSN